MCYESFKNAVQRFVNQAGGEIGLSFSVDEEIGKYRADCSDNITITGNRGGKYITVNWGSGHQSMAAVM